MSVRMFSCLGLLIASCVGTPAWPMDGGRFVHVFPATAETWHEWPIGPDRYDYRWISMHEPRRARARLDRASSEEVLVFDWAAMPFVVAPGEPPRLWLDRNDDRRCEPSEIVLAATHDVSRWSEQDTRWYSFPTVAVPVALPDGTQSILCDVSFEGSLRENQLFIRSATIGHYEGSVELAGRSYPARIDYRVFYERPATERLAPVVILDTSPDGEFDSESDLWFGSHGVVYASGRTWQAHTTIAPETAEVRLDRYAGATGTLRVGGVGGHRLHLQYAPEPARDATAPRLLAGFPLEGESGTSYVLPAGDYALAAAWVVAGATAGYQWAGADDEEPDVASIHLEAASIAELAVGGPFELAVEVTRRPLVGRVQLEPGKYRNAAGMEFAAVARGPQGWQSCEPLWWELRGGDGQLRASGRFSYG